MREVTKDCCPNFLQSFLENIDGRSCNDGSRELIPVFHNPHQKSRPSPPALTSTLGYLVGVPSKAGGRGKLFFLGVSVWSKVLVYEEAVKDLYPDLVYLFLENSTHGMHNDGSRKLIPIYTLTPADPLFWHRSVPYSSLYALKTSVTFHIGLVSRQAECVCLPVFLDYCRFVERSSWLFTRRTS